MPRTSPRRLALRTALAIFCAAAIPTPAIAQTGATRAVFINRHRLPADTLQMLESLFQVRVPDGRYWFGRVSQPARFSPSLSTRAAAAPPTTSTEHSPCGQAAIVKADESTDSIVPGAWTVAPFARSTDS